MALLAGRFHANARCTACIDHQVDKHVVRVHGVPRRSRFRCAPPATAPQSGAHEPPARPHRSYWLFVSGVDGPSASTRAQRTEAFKNVVGPGLGGPAYLEQHGVEGASASHARPRGAAVDAAHRPRPSQWTSNGRRNLSRSVTHVPQAPALPGRGRWVPLTWPVTSALPSPPHHGLRQALGSPCWPTCCAPARASTRRSATARG